MKRMMLLTSAFLLIWSTTSSWAVNRILMLDGRGDYVVIPDHPSLELQGDFTILSWVYLRSHKAAMLISKHRAFINGEGTWYWKLIPEEGAEFGNGHPEQGWRYYRCRSSRLVPNRWLYLTITYSKYEKLLRFYVNGDLEDEVTAPISILDNPRDLYIGRQEALSMDLDGFIDTLEIWSVARSQWQIRRAMTGAPTRDEYGLVGCWDFNDGTANDLTDNGNNGMLKGDAIIGMAGFTAMPKDGRPPLTVQFTPITRDNEITSYLWDFGDGSVSKRISPIHTYQVEGGYTVSLTVTAEGESDTASFKNHVIVDDHKGLDNPDEIVFGVPLTGKISPPGDIDAFKFYANKGDIITLTVSAHDIGSSLNPYLRLWDSEGVELTYSDDTPISPDPYIGCRIPEDGDYIVEIGDVEGKGGDGRFYSLVLRYGGEVRGIVSSSPETIDTRLYQYLFTLIGESVDGDQVCISHDGTSPYGQYSFFLPVGEYRIKVRFGGKEWYYGGTEDKRRAPVVRVTRNDLVRAHFYLPLADWGYLTKGLILGPLENTARTEEDIKTDLLKPIGGEAKAMPRSGDTFTFNGKTLIWKAHGFCIGQVFNQLFGDLLATAYVVAYLRFERAGEIDMWIGSDDDISVWMNDRNVWINTVLRPWVPDQDRLKVKVRAGWNRLLVKVNNRGGVSWGFSVRFPNVRPIEVSLNPDVMVKR
jgi:PKD repeat protein